VPSSRTCGDVSAPASYLFALDCLLVQRLDSSVVDQSAVNILVAEVKHGEVLLAGVFQVSTT
jgi:hypothetical protein